MSTLISGSPLTGSIVKRVRTLISPLSIKPLSITVGRRVLILALIAAVPTEHVSVAGSHGALPTSAEAVAVLASAANEKEEITPSRRTNWRRIPYRYAKV